METTVYDMKTNFSKYAAMLENGEVDEIIVKNRTVPKLRIVRYEEPRSGIKLGVAKNKPWARNYDDDLFDALDEEILADFEASTIFPEGDI